MRDRFRTLAVAAARAADEKKAEDIVLRGIADQTTLAEYMLVASVSSPAHMEAVQDQIRQSLKLEGIQAVHRDGPRSDYWRVLDYGGLLIHLLQPQTREFYSIDKLFYEAPRIPWKKRSPRRAPARR